MNQDGQGDEKFQGPITRARAKRIKENDDDQVAHELMIAIEETMREHLKFKNGGREDDRNHPKLLMGFPGAICTKRSFTPHKKARIGISHIEGMKNSAHGLSPRDTVNFLIEGILLERETRALCL
ncbi:hypothetical protein M9H77_35007 [Catharanthus roseus]|uniref:Uncharacterized protein n=1 Tax=Catharanthus roseus TaxID=4058 RepID=A0ACB9ZPY4_CATRO|nr:hypothetical protein M9H77_35007 [Catharanthus roseus]